MKNQLVIKALFLLLATTRLTAQGSFLSSNYAGQGDNIYLTSCSNNLTADFTSTGANHVWNFPNLAGTSQLHLNFRNPMQTGYPIFLYPYIYNPNNTNLSKTDGSSNNITLSGQTYGMSDMNDYFKKSTSDLKTVATSYKVNYAGILIPLLTQYSSPDVMYKFPINFGNNDTSNSGYTTNIPGVFYQSKALVRTNVVDGWGSVTTPFGTFHNALRMKTTLVENDSISIGGNGIPRFSTTTRELKWFDASKKYPVLIVTQTSVFGIWITSKIQYLDSQRDFQSTALFSYNPLMPTAGATVYFLDLSTNATTYSWNFGDPSSGAANTSSSQNPSHVFTTSGTYQVTFTASNGTFSNSVTIPVVVGLALGINQLSVKDARVFPNPFHSSIDVSGLEGVSHFQLSNTEGKIIYKGNDIGHQDLGSLSNGVYFLNITNGNQSNNYKLIKN